MYLKSIEIQGFKSFPDKTVMTFGSDITAIVGPNGSGKSNISDAIRWVMGEMSTKALRGSKMEDVIFGGTLKRPQVGFAEVSLILDNTEHIFKMDSPEVMVTRRYYRSGDSEYYINRQSARLRDINELFMDTGLGKEGYCNIGQGRIDEILSAKSTDRREIFEEAAGISKYRHHKEETERKLQQTQDNLMRINDKISELELQVNPLREQAEKAKKYLVYRDEMRGLEVTVWLHQLEKLSETAKKAQEDYNSAKFILEQGKADLDSLYAQAEKLSQDLRDLDVEAERLRSRITEAEGDVAEEKSGIAVLNTRHQGNDSNIRRLELELSTQENRSGDLQAQIQGKQLRLEEIDAEQERIDAELQELELQRKLRESEERRQDAALGSLVAERTQLQTLEAELRTNLSANAQNVQNISQRRTQVQETRREAQEKLDNARQEQQKSANQLSAAKDAVTTAQNTISGYQLRSQGRIRKRQQLQEQVNKDKIACDTLSSKIHMYREMEKDFEGYSKATRIVMQESARGTLKNIHGPVSKLLRTDDEFTVAIETALGASMGSIVVGNEQDGKAAIQLLRRRDGGRATFLPLSTIRGRALQENGLDREYGFVGLGSDLIRFDPKYRDIMENLLGRTAIAEDMDSAIAIANRHGHRFRIVTLDGQVLNAGGSMTGGSTSKSSGVLTRANELARMEQQLTKAEKTLQDTRQQLAAAERSAAEAEAEIADAQNGLREAEDALLTLTHAQDHYNILIATLEDAIKTSDRELSIVDELLSGGQNERGALEKKAEECAGKLQELEAKILAAQKELEKATQALQAVTDQETEKRLRQTALEAEKTSTRENIQELTSVAESISGDREDRLKQIEDYKADNLRLEEELTGKEAQLQHLEDKCEALRQELSGIGQRRMALDEKKTRTERDAQQKNKDLMDMERECARLEQKKATTELEEKQIIDKLWDNYELTNSTARQAMVEIESIAAAQKRIAELRRKMNALGHPNLGAIEEFQRVNERYEYLIGQRDDVETSAKELQKIVSDITGEMTGIFTTEFQKINEYFGKTFTEMFGGGKASLQLEDENDVLSCGIEIKVQPPGKQVKTIMLLSGGEKAFVAIALYFAIMKVRPTPFCMLDEIDAALDDRNVARFAAYLRNLSAKTQFIVVTHRRGTMEAADVLYGVTMQEQGVSKVLSVDLNQVVKELNIH
ncbi:MAG: chromosome segregation protein SMC [Oscillospiraceae bacterium]|nr:chromosome segregation protein SMC [Oscillospiraceae bacterium]